MINIQKRREGEKEVQMQEKERHRKDQVVFQSFEEVHLTHFHYTEWPGGEEDHVPSSTHGLLGLVEHALAHQEQASLTGPIAVHCRLVNSTVQQVFVIIFNFL